MKKILIYDVAAEKTGAATVFMKYYDRYSKDDTVETYLITSVMDFLENDHTHVIRLPWTKKSRFHRLYCDYFYVHKLIKQYGIDEVINLQNIAIKGLNVPQSLYLHNAIPISDIEFDFRKERSLWLFKHIISRMILSNLKYADKIIVQAEWIKAELSRRFSVPLDTIVVERVEPGVPRNIERISSDHTIFFYPANFCSYKNHRCIVEACEKLKEQGVNEYEVVFTFKPKADDLEFQNDIKEKKLYIKMVGLLGKEQMEEYYRKSVLLFPSYLETVGLPLVEAQLYDCDIIAADLPYAREAVGNYKNVRWFAHNDSSCLCEIMKEFIRNKKGR